MSDLQLEATLTCPLCRFEKSEVMPTDACRFFYECEGCGELLRPREGDCCVFCSYADLSCPPCQAASRLKQSVLRVAFERLLRANQPVASTELASVLGSPLDDVEESVAALNRHGRVRLDDSGRVVASMGLSIVPTRHEITIAGERRYTWCAYDTIGILAALCADGHIRSRTPLGQPVEIAVAEGNPIDRDDIVLLLPAASLDAVASVVDQWCPNANFFPDSESAAHWAREHEFEGRVLTLSEAAARGVVEWADCCGNLER